MMSYGSYDFGLTEEQELRARSLHTGSVIIDLTFQGPLSPDVFSPDLVEDIRTTYGEHPHDVMAPRGFLVEKALRGEYPIYRQLMDECGVTNALGGGVLSDEAALLDAAVTSARLLRGFDWLRPARHPDDIRQAHADGAHVLWGMCQYNQLRPGDLDLVDAAANLGVMHTVDLAYNTMTFIGTGCTERYDSGLSHFGVQFVARCNEVGIIVDTAHSGRRTTLDACQTSTRPVVATHTCAEALYGTDRAKSDEELRAIAETGGVIGIVTVPFFLAAPDHPHPTIELMLDHIDYVARLVGTEHVAIGTDWPIPFPLSYQQQILTPYFAEVGFRPEHGIDVTSTLDGFRDYRDMINITRGLVARGYVDKEIEGILGENVLRVYEATLR